MARTHARVKGKSGSSKPAVTDLSFVNLKKEEIIKLILEFANKDMSTSLIGLKLRDTYGIPNVKKIIGKSITEVLKENKLLSELPEDLNFLVIKARKLRKHLSLNSKDLHNKRGLILIESKIRRLSTYYKKTNRISSTWRFE